jgi:hypothetical protein
MKDIANPIVRPENRSKLLIKTSPIIDAIRTVIKMVNGTMITHNPIRTR